MANSKYYVVWVGRLPGVYSDWERCKREVDNFEGAKYKSFPSRDMAEAAFLEGYQKHYQKKGATKVICNDPLIGQPILDSLSVDAACSGNPGILEYRGVDTKSGAELFRKGPFPEGTVNIGEFLAIVHGLALLKKMNSDWPIYSDSRTALAWVRDKAIKTKLERTSKNEELFIIVDRALNWLKENNWSNRILKWETEYWGEIPADFGRK
ncbi:MAG: viroplasmin family protein [Syntrophothermus sp.]